MLHTLGSVCVCVCVCLCVCVSHSGMSPYATLWTVAQQVPLSMESSRQEYWSGLPYPSPGNLSDPGIDPRSPPLQADSLYLSHQGSPSNHSVSQSNVIITECYVCIMNKDNNNNSRLPLSCPGHLP